MVLAALAGCAEPPPCDAVIGACIDLTVESTRADTAPLVYLQLGISYDERQHVANASLANGDSAAYPVRIAIGIPNDVALPVDLVVSATRESTIEGTAAATVPTTPDAVIPLTLRLTALEVCVDGGHYCGGDRLRGDPSLLYTCNASGVPLLRERCTAGCVVAPAGDDDYCR